MVNLQSKNIIFESLFISFYSLIMENIHKNKEELKKEIQDIVEDVSLHDINTIQ